MLFTTAAAMLTMLTKALNEGRFDDKLEVFTIPAAVEHRRDRVSADLPAGGDAVLPAHQRALRARSDDPFAHPDAQRRFRVMADVDALDYPWEKWTVFRHPAQRQLVEREYRGGCTTGK